MVNYTDGKVYKITSEHTDKFYVGSTTSTLEQRLDQHVRAFVGYLNGTFHLISSFDIIARGDYQITLLEEVNCNTRYELDLREKHYIHMYRDQVVNKKIPGQTEDELKEYKQEYYQKNKAMLDERSQEYYHNNKERLKAHKNQQVQCGCGGKFTLAGKARHMKSKKHRNFLN